MKEERLVNLYYYQNFQTGQYYYFEDRNMAVYDRYLQGQRRMYRKYQAKSGRSIFGEVYEMPVLASDVKQYNVITDIGVEIELDEMGM